MERDIYTIKTNGQYRHYPRWRRNEENGWMYYIDSKAKTSKRDAPYPKLWFATYDAAALFIKHKTKGWRVGV
jgi:hypothetical protein